MGFRPWKCIGWRISRFEHFSISSRFFYRFSQSAPFPLPISQCLPSRRAGYSIPRSFKSAFFLATLLNLSRSFNFNFTDVVFKSDPTVSCYLISDPHVSRIRSAFWIWIRIRFATVSGCRSLICRTNAYPKYAEKSRNIKRPDPVNTTKGGKICKPRAITSTQLTVTNLV